MIVLYLLQLQIQNTLQFPFKAALEDFTKRHFIKSFHKSMSRLFNMLDRNIFQNHYDTFPMVLIYSFIKYDDKT